MHAHITVAVSTSADGAQRGGRARARLIFGEDVIELVPATAQATNVGPLAVAILYVRFGTRPPGSSS